MIQITRLNHSIGAHTILRDVSATLPEGRLTALIGPNGAGKSTLLRQVARLDPIQQGRITITGLDVTTTPSRDLARQMAFMAQSTTLGTRLRVCELAAFGRWPHHRGRPTASDREIVARTLCALELTALSDRFIDELSGGQRQRAFLAMTLAQDTPWLLLDEPLNNLDMAHARGLMARLQGLCRETGKGVVVVMHDVNYASAWADHIVALRDGRVVAEGSPDTVLTPQSLEAIFDFPVQVHQAGDHRIVLHQF